MKITWGLENATHDPSTITTLGSYDGVHLGHQFILSRLAERKREMGLSRSVLLTFHPHPQEILKRHGKEIELLTTIEERLALLEGKGIDEAIVIKFSEAFSQTSYIEFFREILVGRLGTRAMIVGFNHAFGRNREGDAAHLKQLAPQMGILIEEILPVTVDNVSISSTKIRTALKGGALGDANAWLGRPYAFSGRVVHGDALGRKLGFPTANLELPAPKLIPADGVYAARVILDGKRLQAALSIGTKPTIHSAGERTVEVLLLDFDGDLYDRTLTVECHRYLRPQERFRSLEELREAITRDIQVIREL
ncbi:MAG: bifunctional riboflavin kinase/FAD synthetase [Bacteroidota bacterium]|nr:bifunctional riboflavin kinase/FAD synthetase [Bacteroidota bacterium]MDP4232711.1 bifunctional riboflavin kinase/FAD synthetase [Bacteroidota bacterium]MDP4287613.1 bifunctional riboflavin kinase/FAD synthetase [Bacteroidota bacterium]